MSLAPYAMGYPSQGIALIVVSVVFPILSFATLLLRVKARSRSQKDLDASDYFLFFALVSGLTLSLIMLLMSGLSSLPFAMAPPVSLELCSMPWENLSAL